MVAVAGRTIMSTLLEAGDMRIAKIPASRTLREIASQRRHVPDLWRRKSACGGRQPPIGGAESCVGRKGCDGRKSADPRAAIFVPGDVGCISGADQIDDRSARHAATTPFRKIGAGGAKFGRRCGS